MLYFSISNSVIIFFKFKKCKKNSPIFQELKLWVGYHLKFSYWFPFIEYFVHQCMRWLLLNSILMIFLKIIVISKPIRTKSLFKAIVALSDSVNWTSRTCFLWNCVSYIFLLASFVKNQPYFFTQTWFLEKK